MKRHINTGGNLELQTSLSVSKFGADSRIMPGSVIRVIVPQSMKYLKRNWIFGSYEGNNIAFIIV